MNSFVVSKFGGTSVANASCMLKSAQIAWQQNSNLIVLSATSGTTNLLIEIAQKAEKNTWLECEILLNKIKENHLKIAADINGCAGLLKKLNDYFFELESVTRGIFLHKDCPRSAFDYLQSFGERLSTVLFTEVLTQLWQMAAAVLSDHQPLGATGEGLRSPVLFEDTGGSKQPPMAPNMFSFPS